MLQNLGFSSVALTTPEEQQLKEDVGLVKYGELCAVADAVTDDNDTRFSLYADAEAYFLSQALVRPMATSGADVVISNIAPYTACHGNYGWASYNNVPIFKGMKVYTSAITTEEHDTAKAAWLKGE